MEQKEKQCKKCGVLESIHYPIGLPAMVWDCSKECRKFEPSENPDSGKEARK